MNWEFFAVVKGELAPFHSDSEPVELKSNTLWLFPPGVVHGWRGRRGQKCEVVVFHFSTVSGVVERALGDAAHLGAPLTAQNRNKVVRLAKSLRAHYNNPVLASELLCDRAMIELSLVLLNDWPEMNQSTLGGLHWNKVKGAEEWLRKHIGKSPSIGDAARVVGLSQSQLRRIFWKVRRRNPKQALEKIRFDIAMRLMAESDAKLTKIADEAGFSSATNFCRAFKSFVGKTPSAWRREIYIRYRRPSESNKTDHGQHGRRYREL